jgi:hypothetical protein
MTPARTAGLSSRAAAPGDRAFQHLPALPYTYYVIGGHGPDHDDGIHMRPVRVPVDPASPHTTAEDPAAEGLPEVQVHGVEQRMEKGAMSEGEERPRIKDPESPATENQRRWLAEHGVDPNAANDPRLSKGRASEWIDQIKEPRPDPTRAPAVAAPPLPAAPPMARGSQSSQTEIVARTAGEVSRDLAPEAGDTPRFVSAAEMAQSLMITPLIDLEAMKRNWTAIRDYRNFILSDEECYDNIEGSREMNRTGATRLAMAFGLSMEERGVERIEFTNDKGRPDIRYIVRVRVGRGQRFADGVGSATLSEIPERTRERGRPGDQDYRPGKEVPYGQRDHFGYTRAFTRAHKRAIADVLGGTEAE